MNPNASNTADSDSVLQNLLHQSNSMEATEGDATASSTEPAEPTEYYPHDPDFQLRGAFNNPMVDAAMVLFGLSIRLSTLDKQKDVQRLYDDVSNQIRTILEEIRQRDYDDASYKAYSYSLCLFMDETVMRRPWGVDSVWSHQPLLSEFHKETWGGEKFFTLLERMSNEAAKYQDVLEFMYFCVCLGLKGKYAVLDKGDDELQKVIVKLHRIIRELRGPTPQRLSDPLTNVAPRNMRLSRQWPWWSPWVIASGLLVAIYTAYSWRLNIVTQEVLQSLDNILKL